MREIVGISGSVDRGRYASLNSFFCTRRFFICPTPLLRTRPDPICTVAKFNEWRDSVPILTWFLKISRIYQYIRNTYQIGSSPRRCMRGIHHMCLIRRIAIRALPNFTPKYTPSRPPTSDDRKQTRPLLAPRRLDRVIIVGICNPAIFLPIRRFPLRFADPAGALGAWRCRPGADTGSFSPVVGSLDSASTWRPVPRLLRNFRIFWIPRIISGVLRAPRMSEVAMRLGACIRWRFRLIR